VSTLWWQGGIRRDLSSFVCPLTAQDHPWTSQWRQHAGANATWGTDSAPRQPGPLAAANTFAGPEGMSLQAFENIRRCQQRREAKGNSKLIRALVMRAGRWAFCVLFSL